MLRMLHRASSQSTVDFNLLVAERRLRKEGGRSACVVTEASESSRRLWGGGGAGAEGEERDGGRAEPRLSSLVVIWRISKGKLQPVGFGQQHAHFFIAPVHRGKVL